MRQTKFQSNYPNVDPNYLHIYSRITGKGGNWGISIVNASPPVYLGNSTVFI